MMCAFVRAWVLLALLDAINTGPAHLMDAAARDDESAFKIQYVIGPTGTTTCPHGSQAITNHTECLQAVSGSDSIPGLIPRTGGSFVGTFPSIPTNCVWDCCQAGDDDQTAFNDAIPGMASDNHGPICKQTEPRNEWILTPTGPNGVCQNGSEQVRNQAECAAAASSFGLTFDSVNDASSPSGCIHTTGNMTGIKFNSATGIPNNRVGLVCSQTCDPMTLGNGGIDLGSSNPPDCSGVFPKHSCHVACAEGFEGGGRSVCKHNLDFTRVSCTCRIDTIPITTFLTREAAGADTMVSTARSSAQKAFLGKPNHTFVQQVVFRARE
eukprot:TRINITY_DN968_c0_g2_i1.p1 TRINITY_DN968_c0_g2~~TRINITY_DN968_c0_g2_i1.p1  ORF type:complete len:354 (-),score=42.31 TRINITY_DN968_c0_g2_i1:1178-2149(-)